MVTHHNEPIAYREGGKIIFRMSSFGGCVKSLAASLAGVTPAPPPAVFQKAFNEGHNAEDDILRAFEDDYQTELFGEQGVAEYPYNKGKVIFRGHPDAEANLSFGHAVVDAKYLGPTYFKSIQLGLSEMGHLGIKYATQGLLYLLARNADLFIIAAKSKETGEMFYLELDEDELRDASGLSKGAMRSKVLAVKKYAEDANMLNAPCEDEVFGCPYYFFHSGNTDSLFLDEQQLTYNESEILSGLLQAHVDAGQVKKEAEAAAKAAKKALDSFLDNKHPMPGELSDDTKDEVKASFQVDGFKVSRYQSSRTNVNHKQMEADGIDIEPYKSISYFPVVKVTPPKETDDE